jgi:hypothetical protein
VVAVRCLAYTSSGMYIGPPITSPDSGAVHELHCGEEEGRETFGWAELDHEEGLVRTGSGLNMGQGKEI